MLAEKAGLKDYFCDQNESKQERGEGIDGKVNAGQKIREMEFHSLKKDGDSNEPNK